MRSLILVLLVGCHDTGLTPDTASYDAPLYEPLGPQVAACTHYNCCAIIGGEIACHGDGYGLDNAPSGTAWVGLESNPRHLCAWDDMGDWTCWGSPVNHLAADVPDLQVADLRLGTAGGIALLLDGSIALWGSDYHGQISDAPPLGNEYIAIEAGAGWRCAAEATGALTCWGVEDGEGPEAIEHAQVSHAPADRGFRGLNRGVGDVLSGVDIEGRIYSWGGGYEFTGPLNDVFVANVAPSDNYVCAQLPGGTLACYGDLPAQPIVPVSAVGCGHQRCCAVVEDAFECWGD